MNLKETKNEQIIIGWSNSLIWSALQIQAAPNYQDPTLGEAEGNDHWQVAGQLGYRDGGGAPVQQAYRAIIAQTCPMRERRECWMLASLEVGGEAVDLQALGQDTLDAGKHDREDASPTSSETDIGDTGQEEEPVSPDPNETVEAAARGDAEAATGLEAAEATDIGSTRDEAPVLTEIIDQRTLVLRVQQRLSALGFDTGVPDGQFGPRTKAAIRAYQASRGLADEGLPSIQLLRHLEGQ